MSITARAGLRATTLRTDRDEPQVPISSHVQGPDLGRRIELFVIDATIFGDASHIFRFTNSLQGPDDNGNYFPIEWGGSTYWPAPIMADGFEVNQQGTLPRPKLRVAIMSPEAAAQAGQGASDREQMEQAKKLLMETLNSLDDIIGAKVTRIRTFERYLDKRSDGSANPLKDPTQKFPDDVYRVERKTMQESVLIEFELASVLEQTGKKLPGRIVLRDYCTHTYRRWNSVRSTFEYGEPGRLGAGTPVTCPYMGSKYYGPDGKVTTNPAEDNCGRKLTDCILRFGEEEPLPTRAFPGAARTR